MGHRLKSMVTDSRSRPAIISPLSNKAAIHAISCQSLGKNPVDPKTSILWSAHMSCWVVCVRYRTTVRRKTVIALGWKKSPSSIWIPMKKKEDGYGHSANSHQRGSEQFCRTCHRNLYFNVPKLSLLMGPATNFLTPKVAYPILNLTITDSIDLSNQNYWCVRYQF